MAYVATTLDGLAGQFKAAYLDHGLALVPLLFRTKIPYSDEANDGHRFILTKSEQVADFLRLHPNANWALLGVVQIDCDSSQAVEWAKGMGVASEGIWLLRTRRGLKPIYRPPVDCPPTSCDPTHTRADLMGPKSLLVIPPSIHPSGFKYAWAKGLSPADIPYSELSEPPDAVMEYWRQVAAPPIRARAHRPGPGYLGVIYDAIVSKLLADGLRLRQTSDGGLQGDCPFHKSEGRMAFAIHPERGWLCFGGCGKGRLTALAIRLGIREVKNG